MITIDFDTNCIDRTEISKNSGTIIGLAKLHKEGRIILYRDPFVKIETDKLGGNRGLIVSDWMRENTQGRYHNCSVDINATEEEKRKENEIKRGYTGKEFYETYERVAKIILKYNSEKNPSSMNDYVDMRVLTQHILKKGDFFLSKDEIFHKNGRRNVKAELESEFAGLKIRKPDEDFLKELKGLLSIG